MLLEQKQMHDYIIRINDNEGIVIKLYNSETEYKLPLALILFKAPEGEYRFRSTGVIVVGYELYDILDNNEARSERITELPIIFRLQRYSDK